MSLTFTPSGHRLPEATVIDAVTRHFKILDTHEIKNFYAELVGTGNNTQVKETVLALTKDDSLPIHGVIDWDLREESAGHVHVHAEGLFYTIENAVLNPFTLGAYLLKIYPGCFDLTAAGFDENYNTLAIYDDPVKCQQLADRITTRVMGGLQSNERVTCNFYRGLSLTFDKAYVHMQGHALLKLILTEFPDLKREKKKLLIDVVKREMSVSHGHSLPESFLTLFEQIQHSN